MQTFFSIFAIVFFIMFLYWTYLMFTSEPVFKHDTKSKFIANWNEAGNILVMMFLVVSAAVSYCLKIILTYFNLL